MPLTIRARRSKLKGKHAGRKFEQPPASRSARTVLAQAQRRRRQKQRRHLLAVAPNGRPRPNRLNHELFNYATRVAGGQAGRRLFAAPERNMSPACQTLVCLADKADKCCPSSGARLWRLRRLRLLRRAGGRISHESRPHNFNRPAIVSRRSHTRARNCPLTINLLLSAGSSRSRLSSARCRRNTFDISAVAAAAAAAATPASSARPPASSWPGQVGRKRAPLAADLHGSNVVSRVRSRLSRPARSCNLSRPSCGG